MIRVPSGSPGRVAGGPPIEDPVHGRSRPTEASDQGSGDPERPETVPDRRVMLDHHRLEVVVRETSDPLPAGEIVRDQRGGGDDGPALALRRHPPERLGGVHPEGGDHEDQISRWQGWEGEHPLPASPGQGRRGLDGEEGDVGAEPDGERHHRRGGEGPRGQGVQDPQDAAGIGTAAAEPPTDWDPLHDADTEPRLPSRRRDEAHRGAIREVLFRRPHVGPLDHDVPLAGVERDLDGVGEVDAGEEGLELMKAGGLPREDAQREVDLRLRVDAGGGACGHAASPAAVISRKCRCWRTKYQAPSRVMGTKESRWNPIAQLTARSLGTP